MAKAAKKPKSVLKLPISIIPSQQFSTPSISELATVIRACHPRLHRMVLLRTAPRVQQNSGDSLSHRSGAAGIRAFNDQSLLRFVGLHTRLRTAGFSAQT